MKMNKKILAAALAAMMMTSTAAATLVSADAVAEKPGSGSSASATGTWYRDKDTNKYYFVDNEGISAKGWLFIENKWYYFGGNSEKIEINKNNTTTTITAYAAYRDIKETIDGSSYRFGKDAAMVTGWFNAKNATGGPTADTWELYGTNGVQVKKDWALRDGKWYYLDQDGTMLADKTENIDNKWYKFNKDGSMFTGWEYLGNGTWKYYWSQGMAQGWINDGGNWYYIVSSNVPETVTKADGTVVNTEAYLLVDGTYKIDGKTYTFDKSGKMVANATGWYQDADSNWFYHDDKGNVVTGWKQVNGTWYYFATSTTEYSVGANGNTTPNGVKVGQMLSNGWLYLPDGIYYVNANGAMVTGWVNWYGTWYYMDGSGRMVKGWVNAGNGNWYLTKHDTGAMLTGWVEVTENSWYYLDAAKGGLMAKGWVQTNGYWYYTKADGKMVASSQKGTYVLYTIGGKIYGFADDGKMLTGTHGDLVFGSDGALISSYTEGSQDGLPTAPTI